MCLTYALTRACATGGVVGYTIHTFYVKYALGWEAIVIKGNSRYPLSPLDRLRIRKRLKSCRQRRAYGIHLFSMRILSSLASSGLLFLQAAPETCGGGVKCTFTFEKNP